MIAALICAGLIFLVSWLPTYLILRRVKRRGYIVVNMATGEVVEDHMNYDDLAPQPRGEGEG